MTRADPPSAPLQTRLADGRWVRGGGGARGGWTDGCGSHTRQVSARLFTTATMTPDHSRRRRHENSPAAAGFRVTGLILRVGSYRREKLATPSSWTQPKEHLKRSSRSRQRFNFPPVCFCYRKKISQGVFFFFPLSCPTTPQTSHRFKGTFTRRTCGRLPCPDGRSLFPSTPPAAREDDKQLQA